MDAKVKEAVAHAYNNSPAFRKRMNRAGLSPADINGIDDLSKIPVLKKDTLISLQAKKPPFGGLLAADFSCVARVFMSPGPIFDPQGEKEDYWRLREALEAAGFRRGDIVVNTFSYHLTPAGFMLDSGLRALGAVVIPTGVGKAEQQLRAINHLGVTGYVGTPTLLRDILRKAEEKGHAPGSLSLKKAFVSAEVLSELLRREFEEEWGVVTRQGYGTEDLGIVAYECHEKNGMHVSSGMIVEICNPHTGKPLREGEIGEVVVTLFNPLYPLIRFGTGDLSVLSSKPCPCGRTTPRLLRIAGRIGSSVKVRGIFLHAQQINELISQFPAIKEVQCVITREEHRDVLTMRLGTQEAMSPEEIEGFLKKAKEIMKVKVDLLEFLPPDALKGKPLFDDQRVWD